MSRLLPDRIQIDVTTRCVLNCEHCQSRVMEFPDLHRDMSPATFARLLPALRSARLVRLFGLGEPLMNPHFFAMARQVKQFDNFTLFHTNGMLFDADAAKQAIAIGIDRVVFSVDTAAAHQFARLRRNAELPVVLDNIRTLAELKRQRGATKPEIELCMSISRPTLWEAPRLVLLAAAIGAEKIHYQYVIPYTAAAFQEGMHRVSPAEIRLVLRLTRMLARWKNIEIIRTPQQTDFCAACSPVTCQQPFNDLYLRYDGKVCACNYYAYRHPVQYTMRDGRLHCGEYIGGPVILGDIHKQDILDIYNGPAYTALRESWRCGTPPEPCDRCYFPYGFH